MDTIFNIMIEQKSNQKEQIRFSTEKLKGYFPKGYTLLKKYKQRWKSREIERKKLNEAEDELSNFIKNIIKDSKDIQNIMSKLNEFEMCTMGEMWFWYREYYKAGFIDGISLRIQIKEEKSTFLNDKVGNASDTLFLNICILLKNWLESIFGKIEKIIKS